MIIKEINIRKMKMTMKTPFITGLGTFQEKDFLILEVKDELGNTGWGESVAFLRLGTAKKHWERTYI